MKLLFLLTSLFLLATQQTFGALTQTQASTLKELIKVELERQGGPGIAVSATKEGKLIFASSASYNNVEKGIPFTPHNRMSVGSISKTYVTLAVYSLMDNYPNFDLDTSVQSVLGYLGFDFGEMKISNLLDHTSGLQRSVGGDSIFNLKSIWQKGIYSPNYTEIAGILKNGVKLYKDPGVMPQYSNLAYALLGLVISDVAGKNGFPFTSNIIDERITQYIRQKVISPLGGENHTDLMVASRDKSKEAQGYSGEFGKRDKDPNNAIRFVWPTGQNYMEMAMTHSGVISDVLGLAKLQKFFYDKLTQESNDDVISSKSFNKMMTFKTRSYDHENKFSKYANGTGGVFMEKLELNEERALYLIGHTGTGYSSRSISFIDPDSGFGVNLIVNSKAFDRHAVAKIVLKYLLDNVNYTKTKYHSVAKKRINQGKKLIEMKTKLSKEQIALHPKLREVSLSDLYKYFQDNISLSELNNESLIKSLLEKTFIATAINDTWNQTLAFFNGEERLKTWNKINALDPSEVSVKREQNGKILDFFYDDYDQRGKTPFKTGFTPAFVAFSYFTINLEFEKNESGLIEVSHITHDNTFRMEGTRQGLKQFKNTLPWVFWDIFPGGAQAGETPAQLY